jgi:hypothetical protein
MQSDLYRQCLGTERCRNCHGYGFNYPRFFCAWFLTLNAVKDALHREVADAIFEGANLGSGCTREASA